MTKACVHRLCRRLRAVLVLAPAALLTAAVALSAGVALPTAAYAEEAPETTQNEADTLAVGNVGELQTIESQYIFGTDGQDSIRDLINVDENMDGKMVIVTGEVVGEAIVADSEHRWISISQDGSAIGIYMSVAEADNIQHYGRYGEIGDIITVSGTFHVDCPEHDGDIDVHAASVEMTTDGSAAVHEIDTFKFFVAIAILVLGLSLGVLYWRLTERLR